MIEQEAFTVEQNTAYIAPVTAEDSVAQVEDAKKRALAEKIDIERSGDTGSGADGHAESNVLLDLGLEALGLKTAASLVQFVDERLTDSSGSGATRTGETKQGLGEDLLARANIATSSLDLDPKHVNTDKWGGTDTKMQSVSMAKSLTISKSLANEHALQSVYTAERQHSAMLGHANQMAPGMGLGSGPSINPQQLLKDAERVSEMEDWQKRMAGQV